MIRARNGFTLVEVLVALTIGALVVLLAHAMFTAVADGAGRLAAARAALDREANGRRLLVQLAASLDIGRPGGGAFEGGPHIATFSAWRVGADGTPERRRVTLTLRGDSLALSGLADQSLVLAEGVTKLDVDYLMNYGAAAPWVQSWSSPASAPLAIRMRVRRRAGVDTLLLVIGARG